VPGCLLALAARWQPADREVWYVQRTSSFKKPLLMMGPNLGWNLKSLEIAAL
jgi:hypothetical protein